MGVCIDCTSGECLGHPKNNPKSMAHSLGPKASTHTGERAASPLLFWLHAAPLTVLFGFSTEVFCFPINMGVGVLQLGSGEGSTETEEQESQAGVLHARAAKVQLCCGVQDPLFIPGRVGPLSCQADRQIQGSARGWICDLLPRASLPSSQRKW